MFTQISLLVEDVALRLGRRIRFLRQKCSFTQEELAHRAKIGLKYLQKLEGKKPNNASIAKLQSIADAFGIPLWKLLKFDD